MKHAGPVFWGHRVHIGRCMKTDNITSLYHLTPFQSRSDWLVNCQRFGENAITTCGWHNHVHLTTLGHVHLTTLGQGSPIFHTNNSSSNSFRKLQTILLLVQFPSVHYAHNLTINLTDKSFATKSVRNSANIAIFSYPFAFDVPVTEILVRVLPSFLVWNKNLAIANRSRVNCAHNTLRAA